MRKNSAAVFLWTFFFLCFFEDSSHAKKKEKLGKYIVKPGDSCWSIAQKLFGDPKKYKLIYKYNSLGKPPQLLTPGQVLNIPGLASPNARIEWFRNKVQTKPPNTIDWLRAKKDMSLWKQYRVMTLKRSRANLRFRNNAYLKLKELSLIVIDKEKKSRSPKKLKMKIKVKQGEVQGGLGSLYGREQVEIKTPSSQVQLRSSNTNIKVKNKDSLVSVYQGHANVKASGVNVRVPDNFGTFVKKGKPPMKPKKLPDPPTWEGSLSQTILIPKGFQKKTSLAWNKVKGIATYNIEIAQDKSFSVVLFSSIVNIEESTKDISMTTPLLKANRSYYARVSSLDRIGLQGKPSRTLHLTLSELNVIKTLKKTLMKIGEEKKNVFGFNGVLKIPPPQAKGVTIAHNGSPFKEFTKPMYLYKPGLHKLRFRIKGSKRVETILFQAHKAHASLSSDAEPLQPTQKQFSATLILKNSQGSPMMLPSLALHVSPGNRKIAWKYKKPGVFNALIPLRKKDAGRKLLLTASWIGGELANHSVTVAAPPRPPKEIKKPVKIAPPPPKPFQWKNTSSATENPWIGQAFSSRSAQPMSYIGISGMMIQQPLINNSQDSPFLLRFALQGELSFFKGNMSVDLEVPWYQADLQKNSTNQNKTGDIRIGMRGILFSQSGFILSPSLRVTLPTGGYQRPASLLFAEPGVLLEWKPLSWIRFGSNQTLALGISSFESEHQIYYSSNYGVEVFWKWISFATEVSLGIGSPLRIGSSIQEDIDVSMALSGAIRFHLDRFRVSLLGGGGLLNEEQTFLTNYNLGVQFALGFKGL